MVCLLPQGHDLTGVRQGGLSVISGKCFDRCEARWSVISGKCLTGVRQGGLSVISGKCFDRCEARWSVISGKCLTGVRWSVCYFREMFD